MEPVGLATVAEFLRFWPTSVADPDRVRWELSGMFTGPCGGIGLDIAGLSATGHWEKRDWPTQQWFKEIGVDPFDEGELYVVSQDYEYSFVPVRIFSRREWEGLVHWGIHQSVQGDPDLAERIRAVEAEFYDLDGLLAFTEDRIAGREPWVHDYPLDNPTMMAAMRAAHPQVDYDNLDMQASAETQRHVLRGQTAGPSTGHLIMGAFSAMGAEPRPTDDSDRGAGAETPPSRPG